MSLAARAPSGVRLPATSAQDRFRVCVYCGSRAGHDRAHGDAAAALGQAIGDAGAELVYGGGRAGLMGLLADAALRAGARVVGVIPEMLMVREVGHEGLSELQVVPDMHERKRRMADGADAFVVLPGGIGTMEEFFEVWTWRQLGYHDQPIGLLNVAGYYAPLLGMIDRMVEQGFLGEAQRAMLRLHDDPAALLALLRDDARRATAPDDFSRI